MARPTKFSAGARQRFLEAIAGAAFPEVAARHAGWSPRTYYRYRAGSSVAQRAFREAVEAAEARLELGLGVVAARAAYQDPRLALQVLAKRFPERWGRQAQLRAPGEGAAAQSQPTREVVLDPALLDEVAARLLEAARRERGRGQVGPDSIERFEDRGPRRGSPDEGGTP